MKIYIIQFYTYSSYSYDGTVEADRKYFLTKERRDEYVKEHNILFDMSKAGGYGQPDCWASFDEDEVEE